MPACQPACAVLSHVRLFGMPRTPPGSSVHEIFQATILEWVAISFSKESFRPGIEPTNLPHWQADSLPLSHLGSPTVSPNCLETCSDGFGKQMKERKIQCIQEPKATMYLMNRGFQPAKINTINYYREVWKQNDRERDNKFRNEVPGSL